MVSVRRHIDADLADDSISSWLDSLVSLPSSAREPLERACFCAHRCSIEASNNHRKWQYAYSCYRIGREMVEILIGLGARADVLVAALLYRSVREGILSIDQVADEFGVNCKSLIQGALRMAAMGDLFSAKNDSPHADGLRLQQQRDVRKMLVAMIDDAGVALIKLAERTVVLYAVKEGDVTRRQRVAREIFDIYAPLANRLGVGQLKWELEDLAFRYLQPQQYHHIASLLAERRTQREAYIETVVELLHQRLTAAGINADVKGRVKHIYSIFHKMQRNGLAFHQLCDIRAVRVLVADVRDCYAVLGMVHSIWEHLPKEFDDYIAEPKQNGYQSLHTAVTGPNNKLIEVQIRTRQMHAAAELGVCAHWRYKEGENGFGEKNYEEKIAWLRQMLSQNAY